VEEDMDKVRFIRNLCKPYDVSDIHISGSDEEPVAVVIVSASDKSKLIGKNGRNIEMIRELAKRHHNFKDVQIK
jgi:N utilization substance protein A